MVMQSTSELEPIEIASRDEISSLQFDRLKKSLAHAHENVPHYRAKFEGAGIHPQDLRSLDDLRRFPFTEKRDLREVYPFGMFAVPRGTIPRSASKARARFEKAQVTRRSAFRRDRLFEIRKHVIDRAAIEIPARTPDRVDARHVANVVERISVKQHEFRHFALCHRAE